eukprot:TRINITY_DN5429_c0_g1_i1.p1 TRINITY_DN5429_c0_g1~~TRINITY_DN5429_c0_g1_i1.p1  ORF type:complete len:904 (+),score=198.23 TRINITY_DN5429_c0_g1_i1:3-2714(+)
MRPFLKSYLTRATVTNDILMLHLFMSVLVVADFSSNHGSMARLLEMKQWGSLSMTTFHTDPLRWIKVIFLAPPGSLIGPAFSAVMFFFAGNAAESSLGSSAYSILLFLNCAISPVALFYVLPLFLGMPQGWCPSVEILGLDGILFACLGCLWSQLPMTAPKLVDPDDAHAPHQRGSSFALILWFLGHAVPAVIIVRAFVTGLPLLEPFFTTDIVVALLVFYWLTFQGLVCSNRTSVPSLLIEAALEWALLLVIVFVYRYCLAEFYVGTSEPDSAAVAGVMTWQATSLVTGHLVVVSPLRGWFQQIGVKIQTVLGRFLPLPPVQRVAGDDFSLMRPAGDESKPETPGAYLRAHRWSQAAHVVVVLVLSLVLLAPLSSHKPITEVGPKEEGVVAPVNDAWRSFGLDWLQIVLSEREAMATLDPPAMPSWGTCALREMRTLVEAAPADSLDKLTRGTLASFIRSVLSSSERSPLIIDALSLFSAIIRNSPNAARIISSSGNVANSLTVLVGSGAPEIEWRAAEAIALLSSVSAAFAPKAVELGVTESLLGILARDQTFTSAPSPFFRDRLRLVPTHVAAALEQVMYSAEQRQSVLQAGGVELVLELTVEALRRDIPVAESQANQVVVQPLVSVLSVVALDKEGQDYLSRAGAVPILIRVVEESSQRDAIVSALRALGRLSKGHVSNQVLLGDFGLVEKLVSLLNPIRSADRYSVPRTAAFALGNLINRNDKNTDICLKLNCLEKLIELVHLKTHVVVRTTSDRITVQNQAAAVVFILLTNRRTECEAIIMRDLLPILPDMLKSNVAENSIGALTLLANLAENKETVPEILKNKSFLLHAVPLLAPGKHPQAAALFLSSVIVHDAKTKMKLQANEELLKNIEAVINSTAESPGARSAAAHLYEQLKP